jgi:hypothetical protein
MMKNCLTGIDELITMALAGETEAGSAEVQPVRDSQTMATNCRWDGGLNSAVPLVNAQFRAFVCLKNLLPKASLKSYS